MPQTLSTTVIRPQWAPIMTPLSLIFAHSWHSSSLLPPDCVITTQESHERATGRKSPKRHARDVFPVRQHRWIKSTAIVLIQTLAWLPNGDWASVDWQLKVNMGDIWWRHTCTWWQHYLCQTLSAFALDRFGGYNVYNGSVSNEKYPYKHASNGRLWTGGWWPAPLY